MSDQPVDYLDQIALAAAKDRAKRHEEPVMPEPAGEPVVDYQVVSDAWKEKRGWMDNREKKAE